MLSATLKLEMTHRSICLPDFPTVFASSPMFPERGERQIGRARQVLICSKRQQLFEGLSRFLISAQLGPLGS